MIPSELFFDLVDANVPFGVTRSNRNGPDTVYEVGRARNQRIALKRGSERIAGSAEGILYRLNHLLLSDEMMGGEALAMPRHVMHDAGSRFDVTVEPRVALNPSWGLAARYDISAEILHADLPTQGSILVLEVSNNRKTHIRYADVMEGAVSELGRVSRRALSRKLHEKLVAGGCEWSGRPSVDDSFIEAYGEDAYEAARAAGQSAESEYRVLLSAALAQGREGASRPSR